MDFMDRLGVFLWKLPVRLFWLVAIMWAVSNITFGTVLITGGIVLALFAWDWWRDRDIPL